jgi:hypothetical protein
MIDTNDKTTLDIFGQKRLGRPVTGKAKSDKQRMQEYRLRKKKEQAEKPEITLSVAQFEMLMATINKLTKERDEALQQLQDMRDEAVISILCKPHSM